MRALQDNGITWYSSDRVFEADGKTIVNFDDTRCIDEWVKEADCWLSSNIREYIYPYNPASYIRTMSDNDDELYFGYEDGKLASIVSVTSNRYICQFVEFTEYIAECKDLGIDSKPDYLNLYQAMRALINAKPDNNSSINFLMVNPHMQNRGIGTRAVKTILHNMDYFTTNEDNNTMQSLIHYKNIASQKVFRKNDFYPIYMASQEDKSKNSRYKVVTDIYDNYYHVF